jgi:hypothetical protein
MSAPDRIYAWSWDSEGIVGEGQWHTSSNTSAKEYRRADLPPTLSEALAVPEVRALILALSGPASEAVGLLRHHHPEDAARIDEAIRAALRAIEGGGE